MLSTDSKQRLGVSRELNHPAFQAIRVEQVMIASVVQKIIIQEIKCGLGSYFTQGWMKLVQRICT